MIIQIYSDIFRSFMMIFIRFHTWFGCLKKLLPLMCFPMSSQTLRCDSPPWSREMNRGTGDVTRSWHWSVHCRGKVPSQSDACGNPVFFSCVWSILILKLLVFACFNCFNIFKIHDYPKWDSNIWAFPWRFVVRQTLKDKPGTQLGPNIQRDHIFLLIKYIPSGKLT